MSMKLTAEQVHELIVPHLHARPTFDFGHHGAVWSADFQEIADELNATLGALEPNSNQLEPTRWHELFGTPERAARTLVENHERQATCNYCIMADRPGHPCGDGDYDALLEWLRGDAE